MGTGPDRIHLMWKSAILLCDRDAHRKVKPFLLVRFFCGLPKKMNAAVESRLDGLACFFSIEHLLNRRDSPRQTTGFLYWSKESQQRKDLGMVHKHR
jgi:hypothetical protein